VVAERSTHPLAFIIRVFYGKCKANVYGSTFCL